MNTVEIHVPPATRSFESAIDEAMARLRKAEKLAINTADMRMVADGWLSLAALLK